MMRYPVLTLICGLAVVAMWRSAHKESSMLPASHPSFSSKLVLPVARDGNEQPDAVRWMWTADAANGVAVEWPSVPVFAVQDGAVAEAVDAEEPAGEPEPVAVAATVPRFPAPVSGGPWRPEVERWRPLIGQYGWPIEEAMSVLDCESSGDPGAVSRASAVGLFQIHPYNPAMFDPEANVAAAWEKYRDGVNRGNRWWHWNQWGSCGHFYGGVG